MIKVLLKTETILRTIKEREGLTFTELCRRLAMNKATLSQILKTLTSIGYVERRGDGLFIGQGIMDLAKENMQAQTLGGIAERIAASLAEEIRETVTVGMLRDGQRYNLAKAEYEQSLSVNAAVEQRPSPYDTATGRVLLAFSSPEVVAEVIKHKGFPSGKWPGVNTIEELQQALSKIREAGIALVLSPDGQAESVAAPVLGKNGTLRAAVGASVPCYRFRGERREQLITSVKAAAERMSQELAAHNL